MSPDCRKLFGEHVRQLRLERGLTQDQLAQRAFVHRTYLASVEAGQRNIALVNIVHLARALDVAPADLFSGFTPSVLRRLARNERNRTRARREK